jgi:hypothetical protein
VRSSTTRLVRITVLLAGDALVKREPAAFLAT